MKYAFISSRVPHKPLEASRSTNFPNPKGSDPGYVMKSRDSRLKCNEFLEGGCNSSCPQSDRQRAIAIVNISANIPREAKSSVPNYTSVTTFGRSGQRTQHS